MDSTHAHRAVADLEQELAAIEDDWAKLNHRREVLVSLIAGYRELFPVDRARERSVLPNTIAVDKSKPVLPKNRKGSTPDRIATLLADAAPKDLSPREVLNELLIRRWKTRSDNPIMIVRNTLATMTKSGLLDKRTRQDGTVGYRLKNSDGFSFEGLSVDLLAAPGAGDQERQQDPQLHTEGSSLPARAAGG
jgi:hypothetical protein